jgi:hypothetical protein
MKTIKIQDVRGTSIRLNGRTPLPQRWLRARRWGEAKHLKTPDVAFLKLMLEQEMSGRG